MLAFDLGGYALPVGFHGDIELAVDALAGGEIGGIAVRRPAGSPPHGAAMPRRPGDQNHLSLRSAIATAIAIALSFIVKHSAQDVTHAARVPDHRRFRRHRRRARRALRKPATLWCSTAS